MDSAWVQYEKYHAYYKWMTFEKYNAIEYASFMFKVPVDEICAVINSESEGNPNAISCVGARGLMQVMPFHYAGNPNDLYNITTNVYYGTKYWKWCKTFAKGNFERAIMAYNAGPLLAPKNYPANLRKNYLNVIVHNAITTARMPRKKYEVE